MRLLVDLAAILRFTAGKKNPDFLSEAGALDGLLSQASVVAGTNDSCVEDVSAPRTYLEHELGHRFDPIRIDASFTTPSHGVVLRAKDRPSVC